MNSVFAIAKNTFKEAVRNRILYIILFFALLMIASSGVIGDLALTSHDKIIRDLGFSAINLFGVAIAIFIGVSLVYNELEKKTIYTIVSKPISRWQFILGKYFGLLMTVYVNVLVMTICFLVMIHYFTINPDEASNFFSLLGKSISRAFVTLFAWTAYPATATIMPVILMTMLEIAIVTAFAILYSSFSTPVVSMFMTVFTFIAGRMNEDIILYCENLAKRHEDGTLRYTLAYVAAHVTPNLGVFHRSVTQAVYEGKVQFWWESFVYALLYPAGILCLAILIFNRRNFK